MNAQTDTDMSMENQADNVEMLYEYLKNQPESVLKRLNALKRLQVETFKLEAEFCHKMYLLEKEYRTKQQPMFDKRMQIVCGEYEPTEEESKPVANDQFMEAVVEKLEKCKLTEVEAKPVVGIPDFWLHALRNRDVIAETITENDEKALAYLTDIQCKYMDDQEGFVISFQFRPNEFFTNSVLTKHYKLSTGVDPEKPFCFNGTDIIGRKGCVIDWKPNKNLTMRTRISRSKHSQSKVTKETPVDSFFNFFDPSIDYDHGERLDADAESLLEIDYEIAQTLRDEVVPQAVLLFTGELIELEDYDEDEEEESDGAYESD